MFVSIHIPKTAGTTLGYLFDFGSDRRILWDYHPDYKWAGTLEPHFHAALPFIREHFEFIHGHFLYRKYAEVLRDETFISCVRHPVDRLISQFRHVVMEGRGQTPVSADAISGRLDIVEWIRSAGVHRAQAQHLEGRAVEDYDFIFISERLEESFALFAKLFNFRRKDAFWGQGFPRENVGDKVRRDNWLTPEQARRITTFSDARRQEIFRICPEDVDLYRRAVALFEQRKARAS